VLPGAPLTWAEPLPSSAPVCQLFTRDPRLALPQLTVYGGRLDAVLVAGAPDPGWQWLPVYDLLESAPDDRHVVVEVDDDGAAHLRFGDGMLGAQPQGGDFFRAASRIGSGSAGNVGRDSIVWLALKSGALSADLEPRNPLPATGGTDPESAAEVKLYAPGAFRATPLRAIIADDYAMFAAQAPELQGAAAALEWSGSWYAAVVVVDPLGRETLPVGLAQEIRAQLERYRRVGHDVEVRAPSYVPLLIELFVCVLPDFLTAQIEAGLRNRFSAVLRGDGTPGFFHPDRLRLGEPIYVSALLAEAQAITGVAHVAVTRLSRANDVLGREVPADGVLPIGPREIAQVDNDPDHPDHGSIAFTLGGGR
jgi:predicted phage baseplate assembly protein